MEGARVSSNEASHNNYFPMKTQIVGSRDFAAIPPPRRASRRGGGEGKLCPRMSGEDIKMTSKPLDATRFWCVRNERQNVLGIWQPEDSSNLSSVNSICFSSEIFCTSFSIFFSVFFFFFFFFCRRDETFNLRFISAVANSTFIKFHHSSDFKPVSSGLLRKLLVPVEFQFRSKTNPILSLHSAKFIDLFKFHLCFTIRGRLFDSRFEERLEMI